MKKKNSDPSYFEATLLQLLPVKFEQKPLMAEFEVEVEKHSGCTNVTAKVPRDKNSKTLYVAFPINQKAERLFYACFHGKDGFVIGFSNKGEETFESYSERMQHNPFGKLTGFTAPSKPPKETFDERCPAAQTDKANANRVWTRTEGKPCNLCNRPKNCKMRF